MSHSLTTGTTIAPILECVTAERIMAARGLVELDHSRFIQESQLWARDNLRYYFESVHNKLFGQRLALRNADDARAAQAGDFVSFHVMHQLVDAGITDVQTITANQIANLQGRRFTVASVAEAPNAPEVDVLDDVFSNAALNALKVFKHSSARWNAATTLILGLTTDPIALAHIHIPKPAAPN